MKILERIENLEETQMDYDHVRDIASDVMPYVDEFITQDDAANQFADRDSTENDIMTLESKVDDLEERIEKLEALIDDLTPPSVVYGGR